MLDFVHFIGLNCTNVMCKKNFVVERELTMYNIVAQYNMTILNIIVLNEIYWHILPNIHTFLLQNSLKGMVIFVW